MPSWKKVIVSGSAAELTSLSLTTALTVPNGGTGASTLTSGSILVGDGTNAVTFRTINGSGNITATTGATGLSHSGSFSGSFIGNGANLTGVTATAIFPTSQLTPITTAAQVFVNDGSNKYVTVGQITGSAYAGVSGDITISTTGVAAIQANSVAIGTDVSGLGTGIATALAVNVGSAGAPVIFNGALGTPSSGTLTNTSGLPISGLVSSTSTALGVGSLELGNATDTTLARVSAGVVSIEGNNIITANNFGAGIATFLATPSSANFATALTDETGTAGSVVFSAGPTFTGTANFATIGATGNLTVAGNTIMTGDLLVSGTASFQNTQNLLVADKFILLASGSTVLNDGGIIIAYNTAGSGSALYLEAGAAGSTGAYGRFAFAYDVSSTVSTATADEFVVSAKTAAGAPSAVPTWGGLTNGFGNIYVNSSNQDIFIYS